MSKILSLQKNKEELEHLLEKVNNENVEAFDFVKTESYLQKSIKSFLRNPVGVMSVVMLIAVVIFIIVACFVSPYNYKDIIEVNGMRDATAKNLLPFQYSEYELKAISEGTKIFPHIFGTDSICRDYFARVIMGTILSLSIGIVSSVLVMIIGTIYGSISGLVGGKTDLIMMRIVDIIYSLPEMLIIILLSILFRAIVPLSGRGLFGVLGPNVFSIFIVFALLYWVSMARIVRGQILAIREMDYIVSLKIMGASTKRIIYKHIIPNCLSVIFIAAALEIPAAIFTESYLSFVGLGVEEPLPSLGSLASNALAEMSNYPHKLLFPAIMIVLIVLSFNLLGNSLRDAFDPKQK